MFYYKELPSSFGVLVRVVAALLMSIALVGCMSWLFLESAFTRLVSFKQSSLGAE